MVPEAPSASMLRSSSYPWQKARISSLVEATLSLQTASAITTVMAGPLGHQRHSCESTGSLVAMSAVPTQARAERQSAVSWLIQIACSHHISCSLPSEQDLRLLIRPLEAVASGFFSHILQFLSLSPIGKTFLRSQLNWQGDL